MSYADKVFVENCKLILNSGLSDQEFDKNLMSDLSGTMEFQHIR